MLMTPLTAMAAAGLAISMAFFVSAINERQETMQQLIDQIGERAAHRASTPSGFPTVALEEPTGEALGVPTYAVYADMRNPPSALMTPLKAYVEAGNTVIEFADAQDPKSAPLLFVYANGEFTGVQRTVSGTLFTVKGVVTQDMYLIGPGAVSGADGRVWIEFQPNRPWTNKDKR